MSAAPLAADPAGRQHGRAVFAGADICATAGFLLPQDATRPVFEDDVWDFAMVTGMPRMARRPSQCRLDFTRIPNPRWRVLAKEYLLALMAPSQEQVRVLPHAYRITRSFTTCHRRLRDLGTWLNWLAGEGVRSLSEVTDRHCEAFKIRHSQSPDDQAGSGSVPAAKLTTSLVTAIIDLAFYGELFSTDCYPPGWRPWAGKSAITVAGARPAGENKTQPVREEIIGPLLAAALYITGTLGAHLPGLRRQVRQRAQENLNRAGRGALGGRHHDVAALAAVLDQHMAEGRPLEKATDANLAFRRAAGLDPDDPLNAVSLEALARQAGIWSFKSERYAALLRDKLEQAVATVGVEHAWGRGAALVNTAAGGEQVPWTLPVGEQSVRHLGDYATTACIIVIAAVSGMRASELAELQVGCRRPPQEIAPGMFRHRLASKIIKGQPFGGTDDEWVVIEEACQAVALAENLHADPADGDPLFTADVFRLRYKRFRAWVNGPAGQRLGLHPIPEGQVNLRMLRRTLAIELAYRPAGLLAAKIALKHISVATTEGYAARPGGSQARLLAEIGEHEQRRNLDVLAAEYRNYRNGARPSGPGARELTEYFATIDGTLAEAGTTPGAVATDQQLRNLLARRAQTLHLGPANYCWFTDPARALCLKLAGTPDAGKPLIGMCDSARCPQATHHACHRPVWAQAAASSKVFLGSLSRSQKTERARLEAEAARAQRIITEIDAAASTSPALDEED
jgi:integrase